MTSEPNLILIAGLQKSGTSLLLRLLVDHSRVAANPFDGIEGHGFWGNVPSHAPREYPVGTVYSRRGAEVGHELDAHDADDDVRRILRQRLADLGVPSGLLVNKSPYHTVRLRWLRALFPDSLIVATVRHAVPNVYSLLKKHRRPDERHRPWREDAWYGVKPRGWQQMLDPDVTVQCAQQWSGVMTRLWEDRSCVDLFIGYRQLCRDPAFVVGQIVRARGGELPAGLTLPRLQCLDFEYRHGAMFRSMNEVDVLDPPETGVRELPPLSAMEIAAIESWCRPIEQRFDVLRDAEPFSE